MIYLIIFVILSSPSFQGETTAAVSNGRDYSVENSDVEGNLARVNRGAFTDWFLANKGVSEDSTDEVDSFVVSNSFLSKWCEWFGKRGNGSTRVTNASLCKTYRDYVMHMQTVTTQSPLANSATSTPAATNNAKFVDFENSMNVSSHSSGSHPRTRQTVIIVRRIVEEYSRKKRNDDENDTASGENENEVKHKVTTQDDKISKSSSSESAQDTSSVEQGHGRPYFFVR